MNQEQRPIQKTQSSSGIRLSALRRAFSQPAFVAAVVILGLAAGGLNTAVNVMRVSFMKQPVPMRQWLRAEKPGEAEPADAFPERLGNWVRVWKEEALDKDMGEALGTEQYYFADYVDLSQLGAAGADILESLKDKTPRERRIESQKLRMKEPGAVIHVGVTYYTGKPDTVAHIPDICYVAGGYTTEKAEGVSWAKVRSDGQELPLRFLSFDHKEGGFRANVHVAYTFHVNGVYEENQIRVRQRMQNLLERYAYYAKVEVMNGAANREAAAGEMQDFLRQILPKVEAALPDWQQYKRK
jgi:hypothetical protein